MKAKYYSETKNTKLGNKTKKNYRFCSNYALSRLSSDNRIENLWRRENSDSSSTRLKIDRVYTDIKTTSNTKINHIMVCFTDHYNVIFIGKLP